MNVVLQTTLFILSLKMVTSVPPPSIHGLSHHMPHPHHNYMHHFGPNIGASHVSFETRPSPEYFRFPETHTGFGQHSGFGIQGLSMPPGLSHMGHLGMHSHHGSLGMSSHHVPMYGEPGVRFGMGPGMGHSYFNGFGGSSVPPFTGYGGHFSASQPSVVYHGAAPGHPGIPVVDHGTDRAIEEIMKDHNKGGQASASAQHISHTRQSSHDSGNVLLGIPVLKGHKITLPGFLIHQGRSSHARSSPGHELVGAHSIPQPKVIFGGTVQGKPIVIDHEPNFEVQSTYSVKYPITPVLLKAQAPRGQKGRHSQKDSHRLWG